MWTGHYLPIIANYSQAVGGYTIVVGVWLLYLHHRCHHCKRLARFRVGPHQVPTCHRHREKEEASG